MYDYKPQGLERHIKNKTFSQRSLAESTSTSRPTVIRWLQGEDIYVSKLLKICNHYKIPLGDFITENDLPVSSVFTNSKEQSEALQAASQERSADVAAIMKYEEQMRGIKEGYEEKINRMEKDFLERIGDIREACAEKWARKSMEAVSAERKSLETKYERRLKEQNDEITRLREEIAILRSKLESKENPSYSLPGVLAESEVPRTGR